MQTDPSASFEPEQVALLTHPALNDWVISRNLEKLEESYRRDQRKNPSAIRLRRHAQEMEEVFDKEIANGRFQDTPDLWAAAYSQKIIVSVYAKINALIGNLNRALWLTGGGTRPERLAFEEAQRECDRLRAHLDSKLALAKVQKSKNGPPDEIAPTESRLRRTAPDDVFTHSDCYHIIQYHGRSYTLTDRAAAITKVLHDAYEVSQSWVAATSIREKTGMRHDQRIDHAFRKQDGPQFRKELILSDPKRRLYRLNLPDNR